ncbi:MAG: protein kinase [Blastocatellia bacterium]
MKICQSCGRQYRNRIRHCPMDGTPLTLMPEPSIDSSSNQNNQKAINSLLEDSSAEIELEKTEYHSAISTNIKSYIEDDKAIFDSDLEDDLSSDFEDETEEPPFESRTEVGNEVVSFSSGDLCGHILNNTYRLERKIGHGGMGAVYQATHLKIGDNVAIKFIAEEMAKNPVLVARFQREALAARRIAHSDAVTVYEMNETEQGQLFIVMQYVEGERFDQYLARAGQLTPRRLLQHVRCIADVLDAAHSAGIIHRDLKPSNLMLYKNLRGEERIKVLDFGIAKFISLEEDLEQVAHLTQKGDVFGSPYYMSPEQAFGLNVDARTDIYSLGVLTYQMLTGRLPFEGKTGREVIDKLVSEQPPPPSNYIESEIDFDSVILKALAKEPEYRYTTVVEFLSDLEAQFTLLSDAGMWQEKSITNALSTADFRRVNVSVIPPLAITEYNAQPAPTAPIGGGLTGRLTESVSDRVAIAILPLRCLSADEQTQMLSVGLADTLITELSIVRGLMVRPIRAVLKYENTDVDLLSVGKEMSVQFILDGSVQNFGKRVRVSFRLLDVVENKDIWNDRFELIGEDPFIIQDTVARRIVESLRVNLTDYEKERLAYVPQPLSSDAQQYYIRGRHFFERAVERQDIEMALQMFKRTIEIDNRFARAYIGLAQCQYIFQTGYDNNLDHISLAELNCRQAIDLDPNLADSYATLASIYMDMGRRSEVLDLINKALTITPNNFEADMCLGWYYRSMGQLDKSLAAYRRAMREDPTYWRCYWGMCVAYLYQGMFDEAEKVIDTYIKSLDPRHPVILFLKGIIQIYKNRLNEAEALGLRLRKVLPDLPCGDLLLAHVSAYRQKPQQVNNYLKPISRRFGPKEEFYYWYAQIYARCGQTTNALEYMKKSLAEGNKNFAWFQRDPALENIRNLQAFKELIAEFNK